MSDLEITGPYDEDAISRHPRKHLPLSARQLSQDPPPPSPADEAPVPAPVEEPSGQGAVPWKAAASSVPKLRQQPVAPVTTGGNESFPGFAQDAVTGRGEPRLGELAEDGGEAGVEAAPTSPLAARLPFWELWLEQARGLPRPLLIGGAVVVLLALVLVPMLGSRGDPDVSLARIRQHPEAYDGRSVQVRGKAGETFSIGGSYVFNLRQGRDTIVVYSRTRRPALHETVRASGTISIGYLDGVPRVALFEEQPTP